MLPKAAVDVDRKSSELAFFSGLCSSIIPVLMSSQRLIFSSISSACVGLFYSNAVLFADSLGIVMYVPIF